MSNRRGLPSPALLLGMRPVWYCGGNSCGGCSAFGRSCRKRSMVNCARGSSSDELADDCVGAGCAPWPPVTLGSASGADGRRAMMRDSIGNSACTGYTARNRTEQKVTREQSKCGEKGDNNKTARWVCFCFHLTLDIGAVKRSTLFCWCGNDVWDRSRRKRTIGYWVWYGMHRRLRHTARAQRVVLQERQGETVDVLKPCRHTWLSAYGRSDLWRTRKEAWERCRAGRRINTWDGSRQGI
jgi:hypothetical protein